MIPNPLIVGVVGGGSVDHETAQNAYQLGSLIAARGWILLNGRPKCWRHGVFRPKRQGKRRCNRRHSAG
ncbi:MAG: hypothetical protein PVG52_10105 [Desulfobacterales bacterium]